MSHINLADSFELARRKLGRTPETKPRRHRSDRGEFRIERQILAEFEQLVLGQERPPVADLIGQLMATCRPIGKPVPARATIYRLLAGVRGHHYRMSELPAEIRATLYNLSNDADIPGGQLAFCCLNYGGLSAMSYAAGLPWLDLYQARTKRGWRAKSRGLVDAICRVRHI